VGVDLSEKIPDRAVRFYGLLNKNVEAEALQLDKLYSLCDILIVPSKAEGYGLVFVEAAAYGIPSIAYRSTGVTTAVIHDKSGALLDIGSTETDFANVISSWIENPGLYQNLSSGARSHYEETGNWGTAVTRLSMILENAIKSRKSNE